MLDCFPGYPVPVYLSITLLFLTACLPNSARPARATTPVSTTLVVSLGFTLTLVVTPLEGVGLALWSVCLALAAHVG